MRSAQLFREHETSLDFILDQPIRDWQWVGFPTNHSVSRTHKIDIRKAQKRLLSTLRLFVISSTVKLIDQQNLLFQSWEQSSPAKFSSIRSKIFCFFKLESTQVQQKLSATKSTPYSAPDVEISKQMGKKVNLPQQTPTKLLNRIREGLVTKICTAKIIYRSSGIYCLRRKQFPEIW